MDQSLSLPVQDYLPDEHEYMTYVKKVIRHRCRQAGFRRMTPSLLMEGVWAHKIYGSSDEDIQRVGEIVKDEKRNQTFMLRSDPVVSIARAYIENKMQGWPQPVELYFIESFLSKNVQGELIYEDKFGVQIIGSGDSALTAQVIYLAHKILHDLGLREHYTVQVNHIGSLESRKLFLEDLKNFYYDKHRSLCENCLRLIEKNEYLSLLRCSEEDCSILAQLAPKLDHYQSKEDQENYENLKLFLKELEIEFRENKGLFGMGSYNANTVFEFWHNDKGSQNIIISGGSNDILLEKAGHEKNNMIGFTSETRKVIEAMKTVGIRVPHKDHLQIFVAQLGVKAKRKALSLLQKLRESGIQTVGAMGTGSMRTQLDMAMGFKVKYTLLMGEVEVNEGMVIVRDMKAGTQESVPYNRVVEIMQERIGKEKMDMMENEEISADLKK